MDISTRALSGHFYLRITHLEKTEIHEQTGPSRPDLSAVNFKVSPFRNYASKARTTPGINL
jgi:hypothetical protein